MLVFPNISNTAESDWISLEWIMNWQAKWKIVCRRRETCWEMGESCSTSKLPSDQTKITCGEDVSVLVETSGGLRCVVRETLYLYLSFWALCDRLYFLARCLSLNANLR